MTDEITSGAAGGVASSGAAEVDGAQGASEAPMSLWGGRFAGGPAEALAALSQIGRASCRERVYDDV